MNKAQLFHHCPCDRQRSTDARRKPDVLENFLVVIPKGKVAAKVFALFADIITQQQALIFQIQNLRRMRDLLLPRLLSGPVEVNTAITEEKEE